MANTKEVKCEGFTPEEGLVTYGVVGGGLRLQEEQELVGIGGRGAVGLDPRVGLGSVLGGDLVEGSEDVVLEGHG